MGALVTASTRQPVPEVTREFLLPVARSVFWWGQAEQWLDRTGRFVAQVMTYGDWEETSLALGLLGDEVSQEVLKDPPPGVFDAKSWTYWHCRYGLDVPPLR
jgi:hypothetical protein